MAAEIVNLRRARKAKQRAAAGEKAAENRVRFGLTKAERQRRQAEEALDAARLDGHRLAPGRDDTGGDGGQ